MCFLNFSVVLVRTNAKQSSHTETLCELGQGKAAHKGILEHFTGVFLPLLPQSPHLSLLVEGLDWQSFRLYSFPKLALKSFTAEWNVALIEYSFNC